MDYDIFLSSNFHHPLFLFWSFFGVMVDGIIMEHGGGDRENNNTGIEIVSLLNMGLRFLVFFLFLNTCTFSICKSDGGDSLGRELMLRRTVLLP